jgi:hypothetical protein
MICSAIGLPDFFGRDRDLARHHSGRRHASSHAVAITLDGDGGPGLSDPRFLSVVAEDGQDLRSTSLRAALYRADEEAELRKVTEDGAMLADIYGWFAEVFDTADLKDAKALLDELNC